MISDAECNPNKPFPPLLVFWSGCLDPWLRHWVRMMILLYSCALWVRATYLLEAQGTSETSRKKEQRRRCWVLSSFQVKPEQLCSSKNVKMWGKWEVAKFWAHKFQRVLCLLSCPWVQVRYFERPWEYSSCLSLPTSSSPFFFFPPLNKHMLVQVLKRAEGAFCEDCPMDSSSKVLGSLPIWIIY